MVDDVSLNDYQVSATLPEREEAGTPNIVGAVQLGAVLKVLRTAGMQRVYAHEQTLLSELLSGLTTIPGLHLYGDPDLHRTPRLGTVAFNLTGLEHGLVAAVLNDYHTIALRNGCFCAHPYVRELLKPDLWALDIDPDAEDATALLKPWQGMVRASLGLYTSAADIAALLAALRDLQARADEYRAHYRVDPAGQFHHRHFTIPARALFDPDAVLAQALRRLSDRSGML